MGDGGREDGTATIARAGRPLAGIACLIAGSFVLTLTDAAAKWLTARYPTGEIVSLRAAVVIVIMVVVVAARRRLPMLRIHDLRGQVARGLLACASTMLYIAALGTLPLADAIALAFVSPMFITALAGPMLGEPVGWRRWSAVVVGFLGVLLVLRPGSTAFQAAALFTIASSLCGAMRDVTTRRISRTETSLAILFMSNVAMLVGGMTSLVQGWVMPTLLDAAVLAGSAVLIGTGHYLHIEAFRLAEAAVVAPFKYMSLLWATLFGWLFFGHFPDHGVWAGASVIIASGLYIAHRERRRAVARLRAERRR